MQLYIKYIYTPVPITYLRKRRKETVTRDIGLVKAQNSVF